MNKEQKFIEAFRHPICSKSLVTARAKKLIPHYAAWSREKERFYCTNCSNEVPQGEMLLNKMGICPSCGASVQFTKDKYLYDLLWIYTPDINRASYWHVTQIIHENGEFALNIREDARHTITEKGNKVYWTRDWNSENWHARKTPHFVQNQMHWVERKDWCERNYIIPSQYHSYLERIAPEIRTLGFDAHHPYGDDTRDIWSNIHEGFDADIAKLSEQRRNAIRLMVENGCKDVAMYLVFRPDGYWATGSETGMDPHSAFNFSGKTLQEVLGLNDIQFAEYMSSDKTYESLRKIAFTRMTYTPGTIRPRPEFREECRRKAETLMKKEGLNLDKVFICPSGKGKHLYLRFTAQNVNGRMTLKEQILTRVEDKLLLRGKHLLLKPRFETRAPETTVSVFNALVPVTVLPKQGRKHFIGSNMLRTAMVENPDKALIWEKLKAAGYTTLAKEFSSHIRHREDFPWQMMDTSSGKLHAYMGIPQRFLDVLDKETATISDIQSIQAAYAAVTTISVEDYMIFNLLYPGEKLDKWIADNNQTIHETVRYLYRKAKSNKIQLHEYQRYLGYLTQLNPTEPITRKKAFPADFEKAQLEAHDLLQKEQDKGRAETMRKISEALRADKTFTRFFQKNTKYLVFVPESPAELRREGERLHNCLRTYVNDVANGNTSIFFIRRADAPDTPFAAMEYKDGKIRQIHSDCNKPVDDDVRAFADRFVKLLAKKNYDPRTQIAAVA